ncbi:MAG TPA: hypothetical protein ENK78_01530, partial [Thiothrix sp.]|nr:hypothetical protein [Thiothrix sp.]
HFVLDLQNKQQGRLALISDESELVANISPDHWQIEGDYINFDAIKTLKEEHNQPLAHNNRKNNSKHSPKKSKKQQVAFLEELPNLYFNCQYCFIKGLLLHDLTIKTQRQPQGLAIEHLSAYNQDFSLQAQGQWQAANTKTQLWLNDLTIQQPQNFLQSLGSEIGIVNGDTKLTGQLSWQDTPLAPALKTLDGQLLMEVAAGRFTGADAGLGKILGLLNVSRLGQRLRLDFSDISGKGIAFDGIQGHLQFHQGHLRTDDLILQSSVMLAGIRGDMDLQRQTINQTLSVIPDVKSSLPIVSALFGGLGLGAAVALLDRLTDQQDKQAQLDDETVTMRYKITGALDEPRIEAIESTTMDDDLEDLWE